MTLIDASNPLMIKMDLRFVIHKPHILAQRLMFIHTCYTQFQIIQFQQTEQIGIGFL